MAVRQSIVPDIHSISFSCPHCGAIAHQTWYETFVKLLAKGDHPNIAKVDTLIKIDQHQKLDPNKKEQLRILVTREISGEVFSEKKEQICSDRLTNLFVSRCYSCDRLAVWVHENIAYPPVRNGEPPNADMPEDIRADYEEARAVISASPRSAAALLRLCIQKLCKHFGERGQNINEDIKNLVAKGLDLRIQQALDVVRVVGNEAVHPGQLDLRDDTQTAESLFRLVNLVVEKMVSEPNHIKSMFDKLPESKRAEIEKRDSRK